MAFQKTHTGPDGVETINAYWRIVELHIFNSSKMVGYGIIGQVP